jgi:hypothetical protein
MNNGVRWRALALSVLVALVGSGWVAIRLTQPYDVSLADGLGDTMELVDETAAQVAADRDVAPETDLPNADLARAAWLHNNHSFSDHSVPGYNDCDSWRNILHDGWNAYYGVEFALHGQADAAALLDQTRAMWEQRGYAVTTQVVGDTFTRLAIDTGFATVQLNVDTQRGVASLRGATKCLAP